LDVFHLLVQGHQDPLCVFSEVFIAEGIVGVGDKGSGYTTVVDIEILLEVF